MSDGGPEELKKDGLRKCVRCRRLMIGGRCDCALQLVVLEKQKALKDASEALTAMGPEECGRALADLLDDRRARQTSEQEGGDDE